MFIDLISVRLWVRIIKQNWLNIYVCVKLSRCLLLIKLSSIPRSFHWFLIWNILVESNLAICHKKLKTQVSYFSWCCLKNPHGQRSLAGYSPWSHKEMDMAEWLTHFHICCCRCLGASVMSNSVQSNGL